MKLQQLIEGTDKVDTKLPKYKDGRLKKNAAGDYRIRNKSIESLEGLFPDRVDADVLLDRLNITSLKGSPTEVYGMFKCVMSEITNLEGGPMHVEGNFWIGNNSEFESLKGGPRYIGGNAMLLWNPKLKDIHNIHKHLPEIHGTIGFGNSVHKNVLGLLLIKGLKRVDGFSATAVQNIVNKYLPNNRGMEAVLECQDELIEFASQGSEGYAHL